MCCAPNVWKTIVSTKLWHNSFLIQIHPLLILTFNRFDLGQQYVYIHSDGWTELIIAILFSAFSDFFADTGDKNQRIGPKSLFFS